MYGLYIFNLICVALYCL